jgi:ElaB/YqjD/DUF883 family membrane-anchored ribosome-binding protein
MIPEAKLPHITLPAIRNIPTIPHVGCAASTGTTYVGQQFGNCPDLASVLHLKALQKLLSEQMYALLKGELSDIPRALAYAERLAELTSEVADLVSTLADIVAGVTAEIDAALQFVNDKIATLNAAKNLIEDTPEAARSAVQRVMAERYDRYVQELNAQAGRLQATMACVAG